MTMKQLSSMKQTLKGALTGKRRSSSILPAGALASKDVTTLTVPTSSGVAVEEEIDISQYTKEDLERLRFEDPFLYFSIPAMRRQLYECDSSPNSPARSNESLSSSSRRSSCPSILSGSEPQQQQRRESVTRARRLSTEPHPDLLIKEIMDEMDLDDDFNDSDMDEEEEELIQALKNGTFDL